MPTQQDPVKLAAALQELGVTPQALQAIRSAPPPQARKMLNELKVAAKSRFRKFVLELHPDRNNGNTMKAEKLGFLAEVIKQVEEMEYREPVTSPVRPAPTPPPVPARPVIRDVVFRTVASPSIYTRGGIPHPGHPASPSKGPPGPKGVHVAFLRPT